MRNLMVITLPIALSFGTMSFAKETETLTASGLSEKVEIIKDKWGVSHIYAQNQADLFFAQGYNAAKDRLFQFEIWRRKATGTLAEIMGEKALAHDKGSRLLRFRNDLKAELAHYHEDGTEIILAFVAGVNAFIKETEANPSLLPFEFTALGLKPGRWTPEIVISRHNALTGGISNEIMLAKSITALGAEKTRNLLPFERNTHLKPFDGIDLSKITDDIMAGYRASRSMPRFEASDLLTPEATTEVNQELEEFEPAFDENFWNDPIEGINNIGSNNWVIDGSKTASGKPLMANDPHRTIQSPSLRYMVHLNAPAKDGKKGWNVIGGGEPVLPGVSIGHNEHGAWGLTIFRIDQEDLYVYETNPANPNQYRYNGQWLDMEIETTTIKVKGQGDVTETLKYSRHGPVIFEDKENNIAYGLKAAWLDIGATPYLASLRMDQATTFEEFRDACSFSGLPGENMIWADKNGTIGWQSVGLSPIRFGWDGSLPIPGDGTYEWAGYVPIKQMPNVTNPKEGWYGTANNNNVPDGYPNIFSDFYSEPARVYRLREIMATTTNHSIKDSMALQYDNKSMNAEIVTHHIKALNVPDNLKAAKKLLTNWNHRMDRDSTAAALYDIWEQGMLKALTDRLIPADKQKMVSGVSRFKLTQWIDETSGFAFGDNANETRNAMMVAALDAAVGDLTKRFGADMTGWEYGKIHYAEIIHPLSHLMDEDTQKKINIPALSRGGAGNTLNANHGNSRQRSGASFRMIVDTADWDTTVGTNGPGQSGDPKSPHYADLFENWNKGDYFPMYFSKDKIKANAGSILILKPE
jgi:penicillin amidase